ncbi:hypothetical protein [Fuerstiella marisgermanici]|uniref:Uncharacterized protein n=1 Tax=Fuerstiella marisgermanici TaxID=1891926 RepID=A0A1P8WBL6_9PLAN|nr:hypothetical protein [Fuerstiella marisgermanici]APZ91455.1 hypothetical protein Fuma_01043 [Fuerstiella marisgermanici]
MGIDFQDCLVAYRRHGIRFEYPDIWEITEEAEGGDVLITVASSETCFWTLRILPGCPLPPHVVESCVEAFQDEYDDVEVEEPDASLAGLPACSRNLTFFCLELMNSVGLSSVRTMNFTLLAWWQGTHHELSEAQPMIDHMTNSVRIDSLIGG